MAVLLRRVPSGLPLDHRARAHPHADVRPGRRPEPGERQLIPSVGQPVEARRPGCLVFVGDERSPRNQRRRSRLPSRRAPGRRGRQFVVHVVVHPQQPGLEDRQPRCQDDEPEPAEYEVQASARALSVCSDHERTSASYPFNYIVSFGSHSHPRSVLTPSSGRSAAATAPAKEAYGPPSDSPPP